MIFNVYFLFLIFCKFSIIVSISTSKFYPYGLENGDSVLPKNNHDEVSSEISLRVPVKFFGELYSSLYVNGNGLISFLIPLPQFINLPFPLDYPVLAALYTNADGRGIGNIFYREDASPKLLGRASNEIQQSFPKSGSLFRPTSLFIATWDRISHSHNVVDKKLNTYQVVITSNGNESYIQFLYADDGIQWIQGPGAPDTGLPDAKAQAGLTAVNGKTYTLPGSGTDQIRNLVRLSNTNEAGVWIFRVGDIGSEANVEIPDSQQIISQQVISQQESSCATGFSQCHSQATCVDTNQKFCCTCRKGFFGNGFNCLKEGAAIRATGKVNIDINGIRLTQPDLQAYVVVNEGRVYTAISKVPPSIGILLQLLYPVTATLNWLFAIPTSNGLNGFQITGGILDHTAEITFRDTNDRLSVVQKFFGIDMFDQLKVDLQIIGKIPVDTWEKLIIKDYQTQFNFLAPGLFRSSSTLGYKIESPINHDVEVSKEILLEQTIKFNESCALDFNTMESGQKVQYSYYRVKTARNFITYEAPENILRFAATSKVSLLTENEDPCIEGRVQCVANSSCVVEGDSFKCTCNPGTTYTQAYIEGNKNEFGCLDVNECAEGKNTCDPNAMCVNGIGTYQCICRHGFTGNGYQCTEIETPCEQNFSVCNPPHSYCAVPNDYRTCDCRNGFQKKFIDNKRIGFVCIDKDECEDRPCGANAVCRNLQGSYACECKVGYSGDGYQCQRSNISCDITHNCSPNGECIYNVSSTKYRCLCIKGYYGDGYHCSAYGGRKFVPQVCIGHECFCPPNFGVVNNLCIDKDTVSIQNVDAVSCNSFSSMCHPNAQCVHNSTSNQYHCICNSGYEGNGFDCAATEVSCLKHEICDPHATCQVNNRTGRAFCVCNSHHTGDGFNCVYFGLCNSDNDCKPNEECYYSDETLTYECRCKPGYVQSNGYCSFNRQCPVCHPSARCLTDNSGSSYCECHPGHTGDGVKYCHKLSPPCNIDNNCSPFARCQYNLTSASYECHCKRGFAGNGTVCSLAASCFEMPELCDRNARCLPVVQQGYSSPVLQCQCNDAYIGNGTHCTEIQQHEGGFLFANWGTATLRVPYEPNITNPAYPIQLQANQIAIGLTIDCQRDRVYWSDYYGQKIKSSTFRGKNVTTIVQGNITAPEGVALDWLNQVIYWTDSGKKVIEAADVDGTRRRVVIAKNLTNPRGIAIDPYRRKLFWSDWNRAQPKIEWSSLDGSERSVFHSGSDVQLPNSVTIDISSDELCWADAGTKRIMCAGIETKKQRIITNNCVSPFGLAVSMNKYYWTEKSLGKIGFYDKITEKSGNITLPSIGTGTLYGIVNVPLQC